MGKPFSSFSPSLPPDWWPSQLSNECKVELPCQSPKLFILWCCARVLMAEIPHSECLARMNSCNPEPESKRVTRSRIQNPGPEEELPPQSPPPATKTRSLRPETKRVTEDPSLFHQQPPHKTKNNQDQDQPRPTKTKTRNQNQQSNPRPKALHHQPKEWPPSTQRMTTSNQKNDHQQPKEWPSPESREPDPDPKEWQSPESREPDPDPKEWLPPVQTANPAADLPDRHLQTLQLPFRIVISESRPFDGASTTRLAKDTLASWWRWGWLDGSSGRAPFVKDPRSRRSRQRVGLLGRLSNNGWSRD